MNSQHAHVLRTLNKTRTCGLTRLPSFARTWKALPLASKKIIFSAWTWPVCLCCCIKQIRTEDLGNKKNLNHPLPNVHAGHPAFTLAKDVRMATRLLGYQKKSQQKQAAEFFHTAKLLIAKVTNSWENSCKNGRQKNIHEIIWELQGISSSSNPFRTCQDTRLDSFNRSPGKHIRETVVPVWPGSRSGAPTRRKALSPSCPTRQMPTSSSLKM